MTCSLKFTDGTNSSVPVTFALDAPVVGVTVDSVSPNDAVHGTPITVTGHGFSTTSGYTTFFAAGQDSNFNNVQCPSPNQCTMTAGGGTGTADIRAVVNTTRYSPPNAPFDLFTMHPTTRVTSLNPNAGTTVGGTVVNVTGAYFSTVPGETSFTVGGVAATNVSCSSTTTCVMTTPPGTGVATVLPYVVGGVGFGWAPFGYGIEVLNTTLPSGIAQHHYRTQIQLSGGTAPYHWLLPKASLPKGLRFNARDGVIFGFPQTPGTYAFVVYVADTGPIKFVHNSAIATLTLIVR